MGPAPKQKTTNIKKQKKQNKIKDSHPPGRPRPCAEGELGDEAGLLPTEDDDWSDSARKSNECEPSLGEAARGESGDDITRFKELVLRRLFAGEID